MAYRRGYGRYGRRRGYGRRSYGRYGRSSGSRIVVLQQAPKRTRRRRRTSTKKMDTRPRVSRFALAQANPFHSEANGAKIPDANSVPSCAFQTTLTNTFNVGATGTNVRAFRHCAKAELVVPTIVTGTTWTWTAAFGGSTDNGKLATVQSNFRTIRTVAHGIRLTSPQSPNNVVGNVHICVYTPSYYAASTWDYPSSIDEMSQQPTYKRIPIATLCSRAMTIVNRTVDFSAERYCDPASDQAAQGDDLTFQTSGWAVIIIAVEGVTASTNNVVNAEVVTHVEGVPKTGGLASATPAAMYSPGEIRSVSERTNSADPIIISDANEDSVVRERGFFAGMLDQMAEYGYSAGRMAARAGVQYGMRALGNRVAPGVWSGNPNAGLLTY